MEFAAIPAWLIADEDGRALYPFGRPTRNERGVRYEWSNDNRTEIALGIILRQADCLTGNVADFEATDVELINPWAGT